MRVAVGKRKILWSNPIAMASVKESKRETRELTSLWTSSEETMGPMSAKANQRV